MADTAHYQTDLKLEEMEKRLSAIYSRAGKAVQKRWLIMQSPSMKSQRNYCKHTMTQKLRMKNGKQKRNISVFIDTSKQTSIIYNSSNGKYYLWR